MARYGYSVTWYETFNSGPMKVTISDCDTAEEAKAYAVGQAILLGYVSPKWWQWWRWREVRQDIVRAFRYWLILHGTRKG